jgi:uncharacterized repeat protein (TIGR01451 family)
MSFVARVNDGTPANTTLTAIGTISSDTSDPDTSNNSVSASAVVSTPITQTDLSIAASVVPKSVPQGQLLTFSFTVSNNGQIAATNVILNLETPSQTTFQSMAAPSVWTTQTPSVGGTGILRASIPSIDAGTSAVFTITVNVSSTATVASTITAEATITSETTDSNQGNNRASASATVVQAATAGITVAISGDINPAAVGQAVTYTITVANPGDAAATGTAAHVSVPNDATIVSQGGGSHTSSGIDFGVGSLGAGETRQFQTVVRPLNIGTITLTASATANPDVTVGRPASVTTTVVGAAPGGTLPPNTPPPGTPPPGTPPPTVLSAVRYGFHRQATVLVVTFDKDMNPSDASNHRNYVVLVSANGTDRTVPIGKVWYNTQTHQTTLRVARNIYLFHPWRLIVRGNLTDMSGVGLYSDGVAGHSFVAQMDSHSLNGPSWDAPQASRVGVNAVPAGPLATWAEKVARTVRTQPIRTTMVFGAHRSAKALNARPPVDKKFVKAQALCIVAPSSSPIDSKVERILATRRRVRKVLSRTVDTRSRIADLLGSAAPE